MGEVFSCRCLETPSPVTCMMNVENEGRRSRCTDVRELSRQFACSVALIWHKRHSTRCRCSSRHAARTRLSDNADLRRFWFTSWFTGSVRQLGLPGIQMRAKRPIRRLHVVPKNPPGARPQRIVERHIFYFALARWDGCLRQSFSRAGPVRSE
jgi:hypothetical protein